MEKSFARRYRLTKTDEFSSVFGFRRAIRGKWLMLHYQPRPENHLGARLGLVVGKKFLKRAVHRNLLKRVVRERFRLSRSTLPDADLIVRLIAKPVPLDSKMLAEDVSTLLDKFRQRGKTRETP